jgi:hypothetical protein
VRAASRMGRRERISSSIAGGRESRSAAAAMSGAGASGLWRAGEVAIPDQSTEIVLSIYLGQINQL